MWWPASIFTPRRRSCYVFWEIKCRARSSRSHGHKEGPERESRPLRLLCEGSCPYELALILLSIRSTRLSRSLLRFSNSRSFLSSSVERSPSFSVISATVKVS